MLGISSTQTSAIVLVAIVLLLAALFSTESARSSLAVVTSTVLRVLARIAAACVWMLDYVAPTNMRNGRIGKPGAALLVAANIAAITGWLVLRQLQLVEHFIYGALLAALAIGLFALFLLLGTYFALREEIEVKSWLHNFGR